MYDSVNGGMSVPWLRKIKTDASPQAVALRTQQLNWRVHPVCQAIWAGNRDQSRNDTFVGLIDTDTWMTYLAPTFGVTPEECDRRLGGKVQGGERLRLLRDRLSRFQNLPADLKLVASSTSKEADNARTLEWKEVNRVYGQGACLVPFKDDGRGFDGNSHPCLTYWVKYHISPAPAGDWMMRALGFAIQRDKAGYFVRFASGYNQGAGSLVNNPTKSTVFADRAHAAKDSAREARDLPKEWAEELVRVLARDLHMGCFDSEPPTFLVETGQRAIKIVSLEESCRGMRANPRSSREFTTG
jgi:hypothetical protein